MAHVTRQSCDSLVDRISCFELKYKWWNRTICSNLSADFRNFFCQGNEKFTVLTCPLILQCLYQECDVNVCQSCDFSLWTLESTADLRVSRVSMLKLFLSLADLYDRIWILIFVARFPSRLRFLAKRSELENIALEV